MRKNTERATTRIKGRGRPSVRPKEIYVQIPAYRDSELNRTLLDLYAKAADPMRLRVAVAWQHAPGEHLARGVRELPGLEIIDIPCAASRGCNWARSILQRRWRGEAYTLLLDSHHRFARNWDDATVGMYEAMRSSGIRKPIVTAYLPAYTPALEPAGRRMQPYKIYPFAREHGLLTRLTSFPIPSWRSLTAPVEADFISLHFLFTGGRFNEELPFDPSIYFSGDEVATSVRAYSLGYDFFHPHRVVGWHCYDRTSRVPHWNDHLEWMQQDDRSFATLRRTFTGRRTGRFALAMRRSVREYEARIMVPLAEDR
jgi:hypothetical protein